MRALITGITGQDGSYLAELLLQKGYEVHGLVRRASTNNLHNIIHIVNKLHLHYGDLSDSANVHSIITKVMPDEIYNLAAQSHVSVSFVSPAYTGEVNSLGVLNILEAIRNTDKKIKFYQASTSELFGKVQEIPQTETTPFYPRSPYAVAKLYGYWITVNYRESYDMFACNGILFNHESPRRGIEFVTRKITRGMINAMRGKGSLKLGNLDAKRDWGHAKDYVRAMWLMMQQEKPEDYVISTGTQYSVRDFCKTAANFLGLELEWHGSGETETAIDRNKDRVILEVSKEFYRPAEVNTLLGDSTKARTQLEWKPEYTFKKLVEDMIIGDIHDLGANQRW